MTYGTSELSYNLLIPKAFVECKLSIFVGLSMAFVLLTPCIIKEKMIACSLSRTVV